MKEGRMGAGGDCVCPQCGTKALHSAGTACARQKCPQCGELMVRSS
jgi:hypothetical protein